MSHARPLVVGLNCALGAAEMRPYVEELSRIADTHIGCHPNAGLPNAFGEYEQTPGDMREVLADYAASGFVNLIGGCCGTTPEHIHAMVEAVAGLPPRRAPDLEQRCRLSGLEPLDISPDT